MLTTPQVALARIGLTEVGLVTRRFSRRRLTDDNWIAFKGQVGDRAQMLMAGIRFQIWLLNGVEKYPRPVLSPGTMLPLHTGAGDGGHAG